MFSLRLDALMEHSHYRQNQTANHTRPPEVCSSCITEATQGRTGATAAIGCQQTTRFG